MTNRTLTLAPDAQICPNRAVAGLAGTCRMRSKHFSVVLSLATLLSACGDAGRSPTSASAPPAPATVEATYTLSGAVSEETPTGPAPVEGVRVAEASSGRSAMTDANGFYSISGLRAMSSSVSASKPGYVSNTRTLTIGGDTQLDIRVDRIATYVLSGVVFEITEAGRVPIEGVDVYCDGCGSPVGHTFAYTDTDGFYSFSWTYNGPNPILVKKAGYEIVDPTGRVVGAYGMVTATVNGDTRFDVQLARK